MKTVGRLFVALVLLDGCARDEIPQPVVSDTGDNATIAPEMTDGSGTTDEPGTTDGPDPGTTTGEAGSTDEGSSSGSSSGEAHRRSL